MDDVIDRLRARSTDTLHQLQQSPNRLPLPPGKVPLPARALGVFKRAAHAIASARCMDELEQIVATSIAPIDTTPVVMPRILWMWCGRGAWVGCGDWDCR